MTKRRATRSDIQPDLFAATCADIPVRGQRDTMERPSSALPRDPSCPRLLPTLTT